MEKYIFNGIPENYQHLGCANFSKIDTPKNSILTYTNLETSEKKEIRMTRIKFIDENGINKFKYFPSYFVYK
jgi:hypothetical protein